MPQINKQIFLILSLITALFICLPASAKVFKIATLTPDGSSGMKAMRAAGKVIQQKTDNRVKFKFYPGGVMGSVKAVLQKIRVGQLHGGGLPGGSLDKFYKDAQIYNMPLKFRNFDEIDYVRKQMDPLITKGFEDGGLVTFGLAEGGLAYLMTNQPVSTVKDLRSQKVWVPSDDKSSLLTLKSYGVSPIPLALSDVLASLQTGLINTVTTSPIAAIALQWHTQVKYLTDLPLMYFYMVLTVDKKAFNTISPADQEIVRNVMGDAFVKMDKQNRNDNLQAFKALQKQGIKLVSTPQLESSEWLKAADQASQQLTNEGIISADMLDILDSHLRNYRTHHTASTHVK